MSPPIVTKNLKWTCLKPTGAWLSGCWGSSSFFEFRFESQWKWGWRICSLPVSIESSLCGMPVTPAVSYLLTRLAGCSVDHGISRGAHKLTRTPTLIKKKKMHRHGTNQETMYTKTMQAGSKREIQV